MTRSLIFSQPKNEKPLTIIEFLINRFPYFNKEQWELHLKNHSLSIERRFLTIKKNPQEKSLVCNSSQTKSNKYEFTVINELTSTTTLQQQDRIIFNPIENNEPRINTNYSVLYQDEYLLIVDKPYNLPVSPCGRYNKNTLKRLLESNNAVYPVQRLDKDTSGLLVVATSRDTALKLSRMITPINNKIALCEHEFTKRYHAVVFGQIKEKRVVTSRIGTVYEGRKCGFHVNSTKDSLFFEKIKMCAYPKESNIGKDSYTEINPVKITHNFTLVEIIIYTGRTHQIRVHCASIGHPILGDKLYIASNIDDQHKIIQESQAYLNRSRDELVIYNFTIEEYNDFITLLDIPKKSIPYGDTVRLSFNHHLLHSSNLVFIHPITGNKIDVKSDYKESFTESFQILYFKS